LANPSFDVVSKVDEAELNNAVNQTAKELSQRYDFRGTGAEIQLAGELVTISAEAEARALAALDVFKEKLVKRGVSLKGLTYGPIEPAAGATAKQKITLQQGIPIEKARAIVKLIKDSKKKAQASIQGDLVRISGKDRDTLQEVIALLKQQDFGIDLQFTNYRTN